MTVSLTIERENQKPATFTFPCTSDETAGQALNAFEDALIDLGWGVEL